MQAPEASLIVAASATLLNLFLTMANQARRGGRVTGSIVRGLAQLIAVPAALCAVLLVVDALNYRSGWNALWMIGIPFGVARAFDPGDGVWPLIGLGLLIWGWVSMSAIGVMLGIGA